MNRIAITQRVVELKEQGETCDRLDQQWTVLLESMGFVPLLIPNCLNDPAAYLDSLSVCGVVLSGGNNLTILREQGFPDITDAYPCRDKTETKLIEYCGERGVPLLGICRGLQMIVSHFGGRLRPIDHHVRLMHSIHFSENRFGLSGQFTVNSFHDFGIYPEDLPVNLRPLAVDDEGLVEAVSHVSHNVHGIMWHPEREPMMALTRTLFKQLFGANK